MVPAVITIGGLTLHVYGFLLGLGMWMGAEVAGWVYVREGGDENEFWRVATAVLVGGLVGARIYHVVDYWQYYSVHVGQILAIWQGGLAIWGGILGGLLGIVGYGYWWKRREKKSFDYLKLMDSAAMGLPVGQAIGRLGNWVNQELYGLPTNLPWGVYIDPQHRMVGFGAYSRFQPLFLYEIIGLAVVWILLWWVYRKRWYPVGSGGFLAIYLFGYGMVRYILEPMRIVSWKIGVLAVAQWVSMIMMLGALAYMMQLRSRHEN